MAIAGSGDHEAPGNQPPARAGLIPSLRQSSSRAVRFDHIVMAAAVICLVILVVLPICSLFIGAVSNDGSLTLKFFHEAFSDRLYLQALLNSLILGSWTGLFSVIIGLPLAWAVSRTNVPARR